MEVLFATLHPELVFKNGNLTMSLSHSKLTSSFPPRSEQRPKSQCGGADALGICLLTALPIAPPRSSPFTRTASHLLFLLPGRNCSAETCALPSHSSYSGRPSLTTPSKIVPLSPFIGTPTVTLSSHPLCFLYGTYHGLKLRVPLYIPFLFASPH